MLLAFLSLVGAALISFTFNLLTSTNLEIDSVKALYLAEAGISYGIKELKQDNDFDKDGLGNIPRTKLGDGYFIVKHNPVLFTLTSEGVVNEVRRLVEINYSNTGVVE
jgi:hypothetical protein